MDKLCQRCFDQIQWRIDYKKYKPLSVPSRCHECKKKSIVKAYRMLCDQCAVTKIEVELNLLPEEQIKHDSKQILIEPRAPTEYEYEREE